MINQCISSLARLDITGLRRFAAILGEAVHAGDIILLTGALGAGKSEFARAFVRSATADAGLDVPSPSFTLAQYYETGEKGLQIIHADLYRLENPEEVEELGLDDAMDQHALIIEWADRLPGNYFDDPLWLELSHTDEPQLRALKASGSNRWATKIGALKDVGS